MKIFVLRIDIIHKIVVGPYLDIKLFPIIVTLFSNSAKTYLSVVD